MNKPIRETAIRQAHGRGNCHPYKEDDLKRLLTIAAALTLMAVASAQAAEGTPMGGLGFRSLNGIEVFDVDSQGNVFASFRTVPAIGVRQWFTDMIGVDAAIGFTSLSHESGSPIRKTEKDTGVAFDIGVPIVAKRMDKLMFVLRPGLLYGQGKIKDKLNPTPPNELKTTLFSVSGELEVEYMLTDKLSISAAHGIAYSSAKLENNATPAREAKVTGFESTGNNFTALGFHVYLW